MLPLRAWGWWQWRSTLQSPKLQHYWSLTTRLFSVISRTLIVCGDLAPLQRSSRRILQSQPIEQYNIFVVISQEFNFLCFFCIQNWRIQIIYKQINLNHKFDLKKLQLHIRVDLRVMAMKGDTPYSPSSSELEPHHQMQFSVQARTHHFGRCLTPREGIQSVYSKSHQQGAWILSGKYELNALTRFQKVSWFFNHGCQPEK